MHLTKLAIPKPALAKFAKTRGFSKELTTNYLVHSVMAETFSGCPSPFTVQDKGRLLRILFYSDTDVDQIMKRAQLGSSPEAYEAIRWDEAASKPMPDPFPEALDLTFEVRACPVVRKASAGNGRSQDGQLREWDEGTELDAYLSEQWTTDQDLTREDVYCNWLETQLKNRGGAELKSVKMEGFSLTEMTRRSHDEQRSIKTMKRPDVTLSGVLQVTDAEAFAQLLRSGIGRHKSYGYGLLKIRPA